MTTIPCNDCIVMAMCNAKMHQPEDRRGLNALHIYRSCKLVKNYIDKRYVMRTNKNEWKTSLMAIQVFFIKDYCTNPYVISDNIPLE